MTTQTKPINLSSQTMNTPYCNKNNTQTEPSNSITQTKPLNLSTQSTITSYPYKINIKTEHKKAEDCQCEMEEFSVPSFQSNFARQIHEN